MQCICLQLYFLFHVCNVFSVCVWNVLFVFFFFHFPNAKFVNFHKGKNLSAIFTVRLSAWFTFSTLFRLFQNIFAHIFCSTLQLCDSCSIHLAWRFIQHTTCVRSYLMQPRVSEEAYIQTNVKCARKHTQPTTVKYVRRFRFGFGYHF